MKMPILLPPVFWMRFSLSLCYLCLFLSYFSFSLPHADSLPPLPTPLPISVPIDHFSSSPSANFSLRTQYVSQFYTPGGPLVLLVGPERALSDYELMYSVLSSPAWVKGFSSGGPFLIASEHRYFSPQSSPTPPPFTLQSLQYLTINQSVYDNALIVKYYLSHFATLLSPNIPVITVGGSYAGYLSALLRIYFPSLISASLASCTVPYLDTYIPLDNNEYPLSWYELTSNMFLYASDGKYETCGTAIADAFQVLQNDINNKNFQFIQQQLRLLEPVVTSLDVDRLFSYVKPIFTFLGMFDYSNPAVFCMPNPLDFYCQNVEKIQNVSSSNGYEVILLAMEMYYNKSLTVKLFDYKQQQSLPSAGCPHKVTNQLQLSPSPSFRLSSTFGHPSHYDHNHNEDIHHISDSLSSQTEMIDGPFYDPWFYLSCANWHYASGYGIGIFQEGPTGWSLPKSISACQNAIPGLHAIQYPALIIYGKSTNSTTIGMGGNYSHVVFSWGGQDANRGWVPVEQGGWGEGVAIVGIQNMAHTSDITIESEVNPGNEDLKEGIQKELTILNEWIKERGMGKERGAGDE